MRVYPIHIMTAFFICGNSKIMSLQKCRFQSALRLFDTSQQQLKSNPKDIKDVEVSSILSSSLLISGTAIGGGFLALPKATAPAGFMPSTLGLLFCWLYLLSSALALAEATVHSKRIVTSKSHHDQPISIFRIASLAFGDFIASILAITFIVLIMSTLIAQLSKSGSLLSESVFHSMFSSSICTILFAAFMSAITFVGGYKKTERINSIFTTIMMISFGVITSVASQVAQPERLIRANWQALLPSLSRNCNTGDAWAIPVLLQLLVYSETIPFITEQLNGNLTKISKSIFIGSLIPLLMCIIWTAAAIGVIPFTPYSTTLGIPVFFDPIQTLLCGSSTSSSQIRILRAAILVLAGSAISTTMIGSLLTFCQFLGDIFDIKKYKNHQSNKSFFIATFGIRFLSIVPCTLIAAFGSKGLYYAATAFAGAFPVTFLWGLCPPILCLRLQSIVKKNKENLSIDERNKWIHNENFLSSDTVRCTSKEEVGMISSKFMYLNIFISLVMLVVNIYNGIL